MNSKLELIFKNQQDRKTRISIDEPRADLTATDIQTAMNSIIAENIFDSSGGDLIAISGARIVTTDVQDFEV